MGVRRRMRGVATVVALAGAVVACRTGATLAQPCIRITRHDHAAAMGQALTGEIWAIGLTPADTLSGVPVGREVRSDSAGPVVVVIARDRSGGTGAAFAALANADSLCALEARDLPHDVRPDIGSELEWNEGLAEVAPGIAVTGPTSARVLAVAALTYTTGRPWHVRWMSVVATSGGWDVSGVATTDGARRSFSALLTTHGRLMRLLMRSAPSSPITSR